MAEEGLNKVTLIGRITADPQLRFTQSNQGVLSLRIACTKTWFDANAKERKEKTEFINCVVWGKRGEALNKILSKGSRICIEGEMQTRSYEKPPGDKRYATEVVASNIILLGGKGEGQRRDDGDPQSHHSQSGADYPDAPNDDDIPF